MGRVEVFENCECCESSWCSCCSPDPVKWSFDAGTWSGSCTAGGLCAAGGGVHNLIPFYGSALGTCVWADGFPANAPGFNMCGGGGARWVFRIGSASLGCPGNPAPTTSVTLELFTIGVTANVRYELSSSVHVTCAASLTMTRVLLTGAASTCVGIPTTIIISPSF